MSQKEGVVITDWGLLQKNDFQTAGLIRGDGWGGGGFIERGQRFYGSLFIVNWINGVQSLPRGRSISQTT